MFPQCFTVSHTGNIVFRVSFCFQVANYAYATKMHGSNLVTKLCKFGSHTFANNAQMKNSRDLILGEAVYTSIIYRIPAPFFSLNSTIFSFDHLTGRE